MYTWTVTMPFAVFLRARSRCPVDHRLKALGQQVRTAASAADSSSSSSSEDVFAPENILSQESREKCMKRLKLIQSPRPPTNPTAKEAAVLVPLCIIDGQVSILFTLRSPFMSSHRGQVSFPGGMRDDSDDSFESTAIRETEEELGIPGQQVQIWGRCNLMESINKVTIGPVIGSLGHIDVSDLKFNPHEVGEVFTVPLRHLCDSKNFGYTQFRTGKGYSVPVFLGGKYRVWGLTAGITHMFLSALLPNVYKNRLNYIRPIKL